MAVPWSVTIPYTMPAAGFIENLTDQTAINFIGDAATLTVYASADVAGDTCHLWYHPVGPTPGGELIPGAAPIPVVSTAGAVKTNENFLGQFKLPGHHGMHLRVAGAVGHTGRFLFVVT